jgi:hypothetical protein
LCNVKSVEVQGNYNSVETKEINPIENLQGLGNCNGKMDMVGVQLTINRDMHTLSFRQLCFL